MPNKRSNSNYRELLVEQIDFLQSSAQLFDQGKEPEAKRMAVHMRTLVHDTDASRSLLGQMQLKKKMSFFSMAQPYCSKNLLSQQCLLTMNFSSQHGGTYLPVFKNFNDGKLLDFPAWNKEIVLADQKHKTYNRRDVMLFLANKDGGAHVQPELEEKIAGLADANFGGLFVSDNEGNTYGMNNRAVHMTMRQMTFELLQSIYRVKPRLFSVLYF